MGSGYHKYVFDSERRKFVGRFEDMYAAENDEGFDSWHERDIRMLRKRISLEILNDYAFASVLDVGCGKGTFTHLLKRANNTVVGVDGSSNAIAKARASFPEIEFFQLDVHDLGTMGRSFDAVVIMAVFAYVDDWPTVLQQAAKMTRWIYVAEFIPPDPIGFVKSVDQLVEEVGRAFEIRTKVVVDDVHCMLLGEVRQAEGR
jgi:ubiquinone/menaquinone biosynthesis C-methylase UbiE